MDLYHKKGNKGNKSNRRPQVKYPYPEYNPKKKQNIYIQKMIPQNENLVLSPAVTIPNVRSSMEDIFANEDTKKKAIKYVINIGRNRNRPSRHYDKSASPYRGKKYPTAYGNSNENTPNRQYPKRRGESYVQNRL